MTRVVDRLRPGRTVFSVEFRPPHDDADERLLWNSIRQLEPLDPAYVSVTCGTDARSRDRTVRTTGRIARDTTLLPVAHLTGAGRSVAELRELVGSYGAEGIENVLAIRGDPPEGPAARWIPRPDGVAHADQLVQLVRECGDFSVGVAASPHMHPLSPDVETRTERLRRKIRCGAEFAVTQLFLQPDSYLRLRDRLALRGCHVPLLPGIMPITTPRVLDKYRELAGLEIPSEVASVLEPLRDDPASFRSAGLDLTTRLCERLIAEGVAGLHFYSLNRARAIREMAENLGLADGVLQSA